MRHARLRLGLLFFAAVYCVAQNASDVNTQSQPPGIEQAGKPAHWPTPIVSPQAEYSPEARDRHINGLCKVSMIVDIDGMPQDVRIIRCTDLAFVASSIVAVKKYRFKPATGANGQPMPAKITIVVNYKVTGGHGEDVSVSYAVRTPPGIISAQPDSSGVYPLTGAVDPPKLKKFVDEGYGTASFWAHGRAACDVVLVIDPKGRASDAKVTQCELAQLEQPAEKSLLDSEFKPGRVNGVAVPVRVSIHLEFDGYSTE